MGKVAQREAFMMRRIIWSSQFLQTTLGKSFPTLGAVGSLGCAVHIRKHKLI